VQQRWNLLLAEDNLADAILIREAVALENLPVEIHRAGDGEKARDFILRAESDPDAPVPHLIVLDLNLPRCDGFEVLRYLRSGSRFRDVPVLVVTSSDSPSDRSQAEKLRAGYFRKSHNYDDFLKVGEVLRAMMQENGLI
jgi:CheY-like chemotaxis protein